MQGSLGGGRRGVFQESDGDRSTGPTFSTFLPPLGRNVENVPGKSLRHV